MQAWRNHLKITESQFPYLQKGAGNTFLSGCSEDKQYEGKLSACQIKGS